MGKKNKQGLNKLSSHNKKLIKKMARNDDKIRRAKIQKLKNSAQKIGSKELRVPQLQNFKNKLQAQIERRKNGQKKIQILTQNQQQKNQLSFMQQQEHEMEIDEEIPQQNQHQNHNLKNVKNASQSLDHILENADILLEVLDARDPQGCRCKILERKFITYNPRNKIILVLNKIDLVPQNVALEWKRILSTEFPTVLFKANLQNQNQNLGSNTMFTKSLTQRNELAQQLINSSKALGISQLLQLIKNYSKVDGIKQNVTVGIVGYPNVGKSSIINSMTLKKCVSVSNKPGHTKNIQRIELDSQVTLLDCPGIFFTNESETQLLLKNAIKPEEVQDLEKAIQQIVNRCEKEQLITLYQITDFQDYKQLLILLAQRWGKYKKKGILDLQQTARILIQDWNNGKLKYFVAPPVQLTQYENTIVTNNLIQ